MKKTLCLGLVALLLLSACAPGEGENPSPPAERTPAATASPPAKSPPVDTPSPAPEGTQPPAGGGVWTDWSALEPYEPTQLRYRRWYEEPVRELRAIDGGYGTLVPYVGSAPPDMSWGGVYEYGLMTTDGTIVVDTAYSNVGRLAHWAGGEPVRLPVLALMTTEPAVDEEYGYTYGEQRYGAAALDGSWSIPLEYDGIGAFSAGGFYLWRDRTVFVYGTDGQFRHSISLDNTSGMWLGEWEYEMKCGGGFLVEEEEGVIQLVELDTGERVPLEGVSEVQEYGSGVFVVRSEENGLWGAINPEGQWVIPAKYEELWVAGDSSGLLSAYTGVKSVYVDMEGNEYEENPHPPEEDGPELLGWTSPIEDSYTGEVWYLRSLYPEGEAGYLIEDENGNVLGNTLVMNDAGTQCQCVVNGLFLNIDGETAGYKDRDGNWVFRIPLAEAGD